MNVDLRSGFYDGSADSVDNTVAVTAAGVFKRDETLTGSQLNKHVLLDFAYATLLGVLILADQDTTLYTNDLGTGTPTQTLNLKANVPFFWQKNSGITNPFTADVTAGFYLSNLSATASTVKIRIATP